MKIDLTGNCPVFTPGQTEKAETNNRSSLSGKYKFGGILAPRIGSEY